MSKTFQSKELKLNCEQHLKKPYSQTRKEFKSTRLVVQLHLKLCKYELGSFFLGFSMNKVLNHILSTLLRYSEFEAYLVWVKESKNLFITGKPFSKHFL